MPENVLNERMQWNADGCYHKLSVPRTKLELSEEEPNRIARTKLKSECNTENAGVLLKWLNGFVFEKVG